jgi:replication factor A1
MTGMGTNVLSLEETIDLILKNQSEFDRSAILKMIKEKREELGPEVVNDESAAMIVARELGVDLHQISAKARFKIEDIEETTKCVALTVKILSVGDVRTFKRQDGTEGKVASLGVADETGRIRLVLWDEKTDAVTEEAVTKGTVIRILGGYVKKGLGDALEVNLGRTSTLKVLDDYEIEEMELDLSDADIVKMGELQDKMFGITVRAKVGTVYPMSTFTRKDGSEGRVLSIIAGDETGSARIVFWDDRADEIQDVQVDEVIGVADVLTRAGRYGDTEVHVGSASSIQRNLDDIKAVDMDVSGRTTAEPLGMKSISDLTSDMRDVDIEGKVVGVYEVRTFERDGRQGKVQNVMIADETGRIRVTFWNEDVDKVKKLKEGDVLRIQHGYCKDGYQGGVEYQVGMKAEISINPKDSDLKKVDIAALAQDTIRHYGRVMIGDITDESENKNVEVSGIVVKLPQSSPIYLACPDCKKKVQKEGDEYHCSVCGTIKEVEPRMLYKVTLDDGSGTIRVTLFGEAGETLLGMNATDAKQIIDETGDQNAPLERNADQMLGRYVVVSGRVSRFKDSLDISASGLAFADPVAEIKRMKERIDKIK